MPWKETDKMEQKEKFIHEMLKQEKPFKHLCEEYGISEKTGYKWRSEKSVKAIAPTGAALAFLCFDFFFRIVKGEQPLARCGVGGVQRLSLIHI